MGKKRPDCNYEYGEVWTVHGMEQDAGAFLYLEAGDTTQSISEQRREKFIEALEIIHCYDHSLEILDVIKSDGTNDWQVHMRVINMEIPA